MRKCIPAFLAVWPYIYLAAVFVTKNYLPFSVPTFALYFILTIALYISNIIYAISGTDKSKISFWGLVIAILHFPIQILGVLVSVSLLFIVFIPFFTLPVFAVNIIVWGFLYVDLLLCSIFGIKSVLMLNDRFSCKIKGKILLILSQFCFISNIIGLTYIFRLAKKNDNKI